MSMSVDVAVFAAVVTFVLLGQLLSIAWPTVHSLLMERFPEKSVNSLVLFAIIPVLASLTIFGACVAVASSAGFDVVPEHCHPGASGTQCIPHAPVGGTSPISFLLISVLTVLLVSAIFGYSIKFARYRRLCGTLAYCAKYDQALGAYVVPDDRPFAICSGFARHRIFVSDGLIKKLDDRELQIVLDHERWHAKSAHGALLLLIQCGSITFRPSVRAELVALFHLAAEYSCDRFAAVKCGNNLDVATMLLKIKRMCAPVLQSKNIDNKHFVFSISGGDLERRVAWLVDKPTDVKNEVGDVLWHLLAYSILSAVMLAEIAHLSIEGFFSLLLS